jgi:hypothetical protein
MGHDNAMVASCLHPSHYWWVLSNYTKLNKQFPTIRGSYPHFDPETDEADLPKFKRFVEATLYDDKHFTGYMEKPIKKAYFKVLFS